MIDSIVVKNFMGFHDFSSGAFSSINLFIGKNDTGKTGLLKLLYAATKTIEIYSLISKSEDRSYKRILADKLFNTFQPGKKGLGELVTKGSKEKLSVDIKFNHKKIGYKDRMHFSFGESTNQTIVDSQENINPINDGFKSLFIPAKEVLTAFKAIRATRNSLFMVGFDDTYLDLINALDIKTQQGNVTKELNAVNKKLEQIFDGQIVHGDDDDFVFKKGKTEFQMQMTSEGIKKIGIITTLIRNRQLNENSVIFLDEPETALHPEAARELVEMLYLFAKAGIQVFVTTHNYFVLKQMYLMARREKVSSNCYTLEKEKGGNLSYSITDLMHEFPENAISDEAIKMSDDQIKLELGF